MARMAKYMASSLVISRWGNSIPRVGVSRKPPQSGPLLRKAPLWDIFDHPPLEVRKDFKRLHYLSHCLPLVMASPARKAKCKNEQYRRDPPRGQAFTFCFLFIIAPQQSSPNCGTSGAKCYKNRNYLSF